MPAATFPTLFVPHGAGPCFFMQWEPADTWRRMEAWLRALVATVGERPAALVVVSGHWEAPAFTVNSAPRPGLLYDYQGFPAHTYRIEWPAAGSPELAGRIRRLLTAQGIENRADSTRGLDHGVFIPMKVAFPEADLPVVQVSLRQGLDPAAHLAMGRALAPLRREGVLILGSGMSYHNMAGFRFGGGPLNPASERFDEWLVDTLAMGVDERERRLTDWPLAPGGRASHPRAEHLLPLHVVAGAAAGDAGERVFRDTVMGSVQSAFRFGKAVGADAIGEEDTARS